MPDVAVVVAAYAIVWIVFAGYGYYLARRGQQAASSEGSLR
ncbi:MAG: hypothetical protein AB1762_07985 [Gemmatimonadota bacterium]